MGAKLDGRPDGYCGGGDFGEVKSMKSLIREFEILFAKSFDSVQLMYFAGLISADRWELYCFAWRNSCYRFSSVAAAYQV